MSWVDKAVEIWRVTMRGSISHRRMERALRTPVREHGEKEVLQVLERFLSAHVREGRAEFATPERLAERFGLHQNPERSSGQAMGGAQRVERSARTAALRTQREHAEREREGAENAERCQHLREWFARQPESVRSELEDRAEREAREVGPDPPLPGVVSAFLMNILDKLHPHELADDPEEVRDPSEASDLDDLYVVHERDRMRAS